jgi:hypothetical protein
MRATRPAELPQFEAFWIVLFVFGSRIVALLALGAGESRNDTIILTFGHYFSPGCGNVLANIPHYIGFKVFSQGFVSPCA